VRKWLCMRGSEVDRERLGMTWWDGAGCWGHQSILLLMELMAVWTVLYCAWEMPRPEEEAGSRREAKERATCMRSNHKYCYAA